MNIAIELVKIAAVGLIAGLFSSILANRDYRHRKWWEMRVAAYQGAIEALSDLVYHFDTHFSEETRQRAPLTDDAEKEMKDRWAVAYPKARRLADSGAFLFSDRANAALKQFMVDGKEDCYFEYLDANLDKSKKSLAELVACSKEDLRLREGFLDRWFP